MLNIPRDLQRLLFEIQFGLDATETLPTIISNSSGNEEFYPISKIIKRELQNRNEKPKLSKNQLILLLRTQIYQNSEEKITTLKTFKEVLNHMINCEANNNCSIPHCYSSRQMIRHWNNCNRSDCSMCSPLLQTIENSISKSNAQCTNRVCSASYKKIKFYDNCTIFDCDSCVHLGRVKQHNKERIFGKFVPREALLKHSCRCRDRSCKIPMCIKIRRVIGHTKVCHRKVNSSFVCKEILSFICNHVKMCKENDCVFL